MLILCPYRGRFFFILKSPQNPQHFIKNVVYGKAKKWAGFKPSK